MAMSLKLFFKKEGYRRIHTSHYIEFPVDVNYIKQRLHTCQKRSFTSAFDSSGNKEGRERRHREKRMC